MDTGEPEAVAAFLQARLDTLGREDRAQATMAATWLAELLLDTLNRALLQQGEAAGLGEEDDVEGGAASAAGAAGATAATGVAAGGEGGSAYEQVSEPACTLCRGTSWLPHAHWLGTSHSNRPTPPPDPIPLRNPRCTQAVARLRAFLERYVSVLDPGTTVGLLAGYGRLGELMHYARCRGDWEGVLGYLLQRQEVRPLRHSTQRECRTACTVDVSHTNAGAQRAPSCHPSQCLLRPPPPAFLLRLGRRSARWKCCVSLA